MYCTIIVMSGCGAFVSPVCVLMVWLVTLLVCHLLCPESPPGTTAVHYWYRVLCLVYLMCVCVCVDVIMSVSILHYQDGWNALHLAAANGHLDLVKYLVPRFGQHRFDKTNAGRTCLDLAVEKEKHNVVEYLQ